MKALPPLMRATRCLFICAIITQITFASDPALTINNQDFVAIPETVRKTTKLPIIEIDGEL